MIYRESFAGEAEGRRCGEAYYHSKDEKYTVCVLTGIGDRPIRRLLNYGGWIERAVGEMLLRNADRFMNVGGEEIVQDICNFMYSCIGFDVPGDVTERTSLLGKTWLIVLYSWQSGKLLFMNVGNGAIWTIRQGQDEILAGEANFRRRERAAAEAGIIDAKGLTDESVVLCTGGARKILFEDAEVKPWIIDLLEAGEPDQVCQYLEMNHPDEERGFLFFELKDEE